MIRVSHGSEQTQDIAAQFAQTLKGGECIALHGDLGAGKTQFVRGLVRGLGGDTRSVSSPTYVLLNIYDTGRLNLYHLDAYRVTGPDDFEAIGFSELLEQGAWSWWNGHRASPSFCRRGVSISIWSQRRSRIGQSDSSFQRIGKNRLQVQTETR